MQTIRGTGLQFPPSDPRTNELLDEVTAGHELHLEIETVTAELIGNGGKTRTERRLNEPAIMRVVNAENGIELGSLPDRIVDLIVGSHKGIHTIASITAEVKEIRSNNGISGSKSGNSAQNETQVYEPSARNDPRGDHCRECGADIAGRTARFCPHCGAEQ
jgi:hypothetical protein